MEIKIEVGEERFSEVLQKELEAFSKEELHEICRKALIAQMSNPTVFEDMFIDREQGYSYNRYSARDVLIDAAKTVNFDETYKEMQNSIIKYIKDNHIKILHDIAINMFLEGLTRSITYNDTFKDNLRSHLYSTLDSIKNNNS